MKSGASPSHVIQPDQKIQVLHPGVHAMSRGFAVGMVLFGIACATPRQDSPPPDLSVVRTELDCLWAQ